MARLTYGLMQSLDGYVAGREDGPQLPAPGEALRRYLTDQMRRTAGCLCGRRTYELMRDWDVEHPEDGPILHEFAEVRRSRPSRVVSRSLQSVGPNATLVRGDVGAFAKRLKAEQQSEIAVAGPELARSLTELGLIDEYFCPVLPGAGRPFFAGPRPRLPRREARRSTRTRCCCATFRPERGSVLPKRKGRAGPGLFSLVSRAQRFFLSGWW